MQLFRKLSDTEIQEFIQWARENYVPLSPIDGTWHPVIQAECIAINAKTEVEVK
jgi:hypothetical protein